MCPHSKAITNIWGNQISDEFPHSLDSGIGCKSNYTQICHELGGQIFKESKVFPKLRLHCLPLLAGLGSILYLYLDETNHLRSIIVLCLRDFPRGKPEGTPKGEGLYLTIYSELRQYITVFKCQSPFAFETHVFLENQFELIFQEMLLKMYKFNCFTTKSQRKHFLGKLWNIGEGILNFYTEIVFLD